MRAIPLLAVLLAVAVTAPAWAGSPHFVGTPTVQRSSDDLTVSGKIAGLGNETQVHVVATAEAECVNRGGHNPSADNKDTFSVEGDFPVQNGKALFNLTLEAAFDPSCSPPMTVLWSDVTVTDAEHGLTATIAGPF
jgi:hypothetical protein